MGITFVENDGECGGVCVEKVSETGSAFSATPAIKANDQLVAVDGDLVFGKDYDSAIGMIKSSSGETTKLVFYRGPTQFLYGPTKPDDKWYVTNFGLNGEGLVEAEDSDLGDV